MSDIEKVLEKHVGNSSELLGVLHDLSYSMVLGVLIGEMKEVLKEEEKGLKQVIGDLEALIIGQKEIQKLKDLIVDLEEIKNPSTTIIRDKIRTRYMK